MAHISKDRKIKFFIYMILNWAPIMIVANNTCALMFCQVLFSLLSWAITFRLHTNPLKVVLLRSPLDR